MLVVKITRDCLASVNYDMCLFVFAYSYIEVDFEKIFILNVASLYCVVIYFQKSINRWIVNLAYKNFFGKKTQRNDQKKIKFQSQVAFSPMKKVFSTTGEQVRLCTAHFTLRCFHKNITLSYCLRFDVFANSSKFFSFSGLNFCCYVVAPCPFNDRISYSKSRRLIFR